MNDSLAFLGLLVLAYVFLTPLVIIIMAVRNRRRIRRLEAENELLGERLQKLETMKGEPVMASAEPVPVPPDPVPEPVPTPPEPVPGPPSVSPAPLPEQPMEVKEPTPVPQAVPEAQASTAEVEERPVWWVAAAIKDFMVGIGMWPPASASGRNRETLLMQWWLPRIGGMLALLSALFFGVYINQSTSPFFKCLELVAVSLLIAGGGRFLERRYATFGGVVMVTGLIMLYMTSVAAYVLPAVRVIENPLVGTLVQAAILGFICVVGFLRRSQAIVFLAFAFGLFLGVFMAWEGLREGALIASILLFMAGIILSRISCFNRLIWVITPGAFLVALAFPAITLLRPVEIPGGLSMQVFINVVLASVVTSYFMGTLGKGWQARLLQSIASSLAIVATLWFFRSFYADDLQWAALILGINMLVGSLIAWRVRGCGFLAQLLFIKASFLVAIWALLHYSGDLRWMVLALETIVLATTARRSGRIAMELATWAVAGVSYLYFSGVLLSPQSYDSFVWWMAVLYPAVILLAMSYMLPVFYVAGIPLRDLSRKWAYGFLPLIALFIWYKLVQLTFPRPFDPSLPFIIIVYAFGAISLVPFLKRWFLQITAAGGFVLASVMFWGEPFSFLILMALLVAAAIGLFKLTQSGDKGSIAGENAIYFLSILPLTLWVFQFLDDWVGQAVFASGLSIAVLLLGSVPRLRHVGSWSFLPILLFLLTESSSPSDQSWNLVALILGVGWIFIPVLVRGVNTGIGWAVKAQLWSWLGALLLWVYAINLSDSNLPWIRYQVITGALAVVFLAASSKWKIPGYFFAAMLFLATLAGRHALISLGEFASRTPWDSEVLISGGILYGLALMLFFLKPFPFSIEKEERKAAFQKFFSGVAGLLFFGTSVITFSYEPLISMSWFTPILAVTAFLMIILGLFWNDTVFRRLGLVLLAVPLIRLFLVDVQDVLHRIIAFAAAAVLLTLLGYLYHRLSARMEGD
jgi:hypothetical protein